MEKRTLKSTFIILFLCLVGIIALCIWVAKTDLGEKKMIAEEEIAPGKDVYIEPSPEEIEMEADSMTMNLLLYHPLTDEEKNSLVSSWEKQGKFIVSATAYNPEKEQCWGDPLITASGRYIDTVALRNEEIRWIAISRDLRKFFSFGDTVCVRVYSDPEMSGMYVVHDIMGSRWTRKIDFLRHKENRCKGKWENVLIYKKRGS